MDSVAPGALICPVFIQTGGGPCGADYYTEDGLQRHAERDHGFKRWRARELVSIAIKDRQRRLARSP